MEDRPDLLSVPKTDIHVRLLELLLRANACDLEELRSRPYWKN